MTGQKDRTTDTGEEDSDLENKGHWEFQVAVNVSATY